MKLKFSVRRPSTWHFTGVYIRLTYDSLLLFVQGNDRGNEGLRLTVVLKSVISSQTNGFHLHKMLQLRENGVNIIKVKRTQI